MTFFNCWIIERHDAFAPTAAHSFVLSLLVVALLIGGSIVASLIRTRRGRGGARKQREAHA